MLVNECESNMFAGLQPMPPKGPCLLRVISPRLNSWRRRWWWWGHNRRNHATCSLQQPKNIKHHQQLHLKSYAVLKAIHLSGAYWSSGCMELCKKWQVWQNGRIRVVAPSVSMAGIEIKALFLFLNVSIPLDMSRIFILDTACYNM